MLISDKGIEFIKSFEGCVLTAYLCPSKVWTIGYGHTEGVKEGDTISKEHAEAYLLSDLRKYERYVHDTKLELNQGQYDALVSFTYNCGKGNLESLIKNRTLEEIADALLLYNKSNGETLQGLVKRRTAERDMFLGIEEVEEMSEMLTINAFSKSKDGNKNVSANFKVKEFACSDGSDPIFISPKLVELLQKIRNHFGKPVVINSAFRTASHNKVVGGATYSQHLYGTAADIRISGVEPKKVAEYVETLLENTGGIGIYSSFVHVDVRETKSRWNG